MLNYQRVDIHTVGAIRAQGVLYIGTNFCVLDSLHHGNFTLANPLAWVVVASGFSFGGYGTTIVHYSTL